jgi:hypothetical protein
VNPVLAAGLIWIKREPVSSSCRRLPCRFAAVVPGVAGDQVAVGVGFIPVSIKMRAEILAAAPTACGSPVETRPPSNMLTRGRPLYVGIAAGSSV